MCLVVSKFYKEEMLNLRTDSMRERETETERQREREWKREREKAVKQG